MTDDLRNELLEELRKQTQVATESLRLAEQMRIETKAKLEESMVAVRKARRDSRWLMVLLVAIFLVPIGYSYLSGLFASSRLPDPEDDPEVRTPYSREWYELRKSNLRVALSMGRFDQLDSLRHPFLDSNRLDPEAFQILAEADFVRGRLDSAKVLYTMAESLLHDDANVRHLEAIERRTGGR